MTLDQALARYLPHVELRAAGVNLVGRCPFHSEKTGSFTVNTRKQIWKCFGCGLGGTVIDLVMAAYNCDKVEAARTLAEDFGVWVPGNMVHPKSLVERRKIAAARRETETRNEERQLEDAFERWCKLAYTQIALVYRCGERAVRTAKNPFELSDVAHWLPRLGHYLDILLYGSDNEKLEFFLSEEARMWAI